MDQKQLTKHMPDRRSQSDCRWNQLHIRSSNTDWEMLLHLQCKSKYPTAVYILSSHKSQVTVAYCTGYTILWQKLSKTLEAVHLLSPGRCSGTDFLQKSGRTTHCRVSKSQLKTYYFWLWSPLARASLNWTPCYGAFALEVSVLLLLLLSMASREIGPSRIWSIAKIDWLSKV